MTGKLKWCPQADKNVAGRFSNSRMIESVANDRSFILKLSGKPFRALTMDLSFILSFNLSSPWKDVSNMV